MAKILYEKLELAVLQLAPTLIGKGLKDIDLFPNHGPCCLGAQNKAKKDQSWDYRLIAYKGNQELILAEFQRGSQGLDIMVKDTPYSSEILNTLNHLSSKT